MITLEDVTKVYQMGDIEVHALRGVSLNIRPSEMVAIMGPSGSGKSTMMNIIGCLDQPTSGSYGLAGDEVSALSDDELAEVRGGKIGFVFQNFNLLPRMTAVEQVEVPLIYSGAPNRRERTAAALESVGLADRMHHKPTELFWRATAKGCHRSRYRHGSCDYSRRRTHRCVGHQDEPGDYGHFSTAQRGSWPHYHLCDTRAVRSP